MEEEGAKRAMTGEKNVSLVDKSYRNTAGPLLQLGFLFCNSASIIC
jgi:hypothetical protein